ncbi:MAG: hypothetical protein QF893_18250 [Alphaproteobacteria bacterium]|jgi:hypothetical protein|nr:hypothetical protein [Alphaproteobacteria bacterium]
MLDKLKKLDRILSSSTEERRREAREDLVDATAEIAGQRYPVGNWSAHGFCIGPSLMTPKPGDRLDIGFSIPLPDRRLEFSCRVGVMRYDKERQEFGASSSISMKRYRTSSTSTFRSSRRSATARICCRTCDPPCAAGKQARHRRIRGSTGPAPVTAAGADGSVASGP